MLLKYFNTVLKYIHTIIFFFKTKRFIFIKYMFQQIFKQICV